MDIDLNATLITDEYSSSNEETDEEEHADSCIHIIKHVTVSENQSISSGSYFEDVDYLKKKDTEAYSGYAKTSAIQQLIESDTDSDDYSELEVLFDEDVDDLDDVEEAIVEEYITSYKQSKLDIVKEIDFFSQFPSFVQDKLFHSLIERNFKAGELIIQEGGRGDGMYLIINGTAQVWINKDKRHITNLYKKMYFGERALLYSARRCANVTAVEDTECLYLSKDSFREIKEVRPYLLVKKLPIIQKLSQEQQIAIASNMKTKSFEKDEVLMEKGTYGNAFYVIMSGTAGVLAANGEIELRLREGNLLGQKSVLLGHKRNATVKAISNLVCVELQKKHVEEHTDLREILMEEIRRTNMTRTLRQTRRNSSNYINTMSPSELTIDPVSINSFRRISSINVPKSPVKKQKALRVVQTVDGKKRINDWYVENKLGKGSFGIVFRCQHVDSKEIATIKIINKPNFTAREKRNINDLYKEVEIMSGLSHKNIVQLIALIDDPKADDLIIVMEYCEKRGIFDSDIYEPLSEDQARKYFRDVLSGLDYLHYQGVCHRDIKPMNLFVTAEDVVKIGDFGTACRFQEKKTFSLQKLVEVAGTPAFMAPEILVEENSSYHGPAVDLWSSGATLYMFVVGTPPWNCTDEIQLMHNVKFNELKFPDDWASRNLSMTLTHLIQDLLKKNWKERLSLLETMQHDWVTKEQSDPLDIVYCYEGKSRATKSTHFSFDVYTSGTRPNLKVFSPRRPMRFNSKRNLLEQAIKGNSKSFCVRVPRTGGVSTFEAPLTLPSHSRRKSALPDLSDIEMEDGSRSVSFHKPSRNSSAASSLEYSTKSLKSRLTKSCLSIDLNSIDIEYFDSFLEAIRHTSVRNSLIGEDVDCITGHLTQNSNVHLMNLYNRRNSFKSQSTSSTPGLKDGTSSLSFSSLKYNMSIRLFLQGNVVHSSRLLYGTYLTLGTRRVQEDRISIAEEFNFPGEVYFFAGVFDGFGGELVSDLVSRKIPFYIGRRISEGFEASQALFDSIITVNKRYLKKAAKSVKKDRTSNPEDYRLKSLLRTRKGTCSQIIKYQTSGSTGAMVLIETKQEGQFLHVAWVGDSRVLLAQNGSFQVLTEDHKSVAPSEKARIIEAGGSIIRNRLNGSMLVSRGFGSLHVVGKAVPDIVSQCDNVLDLLKLEKERNAALQERTYEDDLTCNGPFSCMPGRLTLRIASDFEFLVLASDGLFEEGTNEEVISYTRDVLNSVKDVSQTAKLLVKQFENSDNTSAIVVKLNA